MVLMTACQTLLMVSVAYGQGRIQGGKIKGICILPPAIFKNIFDVYNFSVVTNLFDSDKPCALSTHNRKCPNKMNQIFFVFSCIFILLSRESDQWAVRARLGCR